MDEIQGQCVHNIIYIVTFMCVKAFLENVSYVTGSPGTTDQLSSLQFSQSIDSGMADVWLQFSQSIDSGMTDVWLTVQSKR